MKTKLSYSCPACQKVLVEFKKKQDEKEKGKCYYCQIEYKLEELQPEERPITEFKKRSVKEDEIIKREEFLQLLYDIKDKIFLVKGKPVYFGPREIAWFALLYLTGSRISELCNYVNRYDLAKEKFYGPKRRQFETEELVNSKGKVTHWMRVNGLKILKTRGKDGFKYRDIILSYEHDWEFLQLVENYLNTLDYEDVLFKFSSEWGRKLFAPIDSFVWPHALRAMRTYDLRKIYGWKNEDIIHFIGWQNMNTIKNYLKLTTLDLVDATRF